MFVRRRQRLRLVARCWESQPDRMIANEMRRDSSSICQNENFGVRRSTRSTTAATASTSRSTRSAAASTARSPTSAVQRRLEPDLGRVDVGRFEGGWTVEAAMPFKSLRYRPGRAQIWGIQRPPHQPLEERDLVPDAACPAASGSAAASSQLSLAATLVGLEAPPASRNLEIKPYAIVEPHDRPTVDAARAQRPRRRRRPRREVRPHAEPDRRLHLQHRLRPGRGRRAAGQPHALQPVLPREARVLPREPGHVRVRRRSGGNAAGDTPVLFYSRRIGLDSGRGVPIDGGRAPDRPRRPLQHRRARTSRPATTTALGAPATNFSVAAA